MASMESAKGDQPQSGAYNFASVFAAEAEEIDKQCILRGAEPDLHFDSDQRHPGPPHAIPDRFGLAFSGGGIRSASVALGVVQALANSGMLRQVHYISGISGGGYLLGWLTAWIARQDSYAAGEEKPPGERQSFSQVENQLASNSSTEKVESVAQPPSYQRHLEPYPIHYLRQYTSYLTPRKGLFSGDLLAMVSIYLRNVLLNMTMIGSLAVALMLLLQFPAYLNTIWQLSGVFCRGPLFWVVGFVFLAAFAVGTGSAAYSLHQVVNQKTSPIPHAGGIVIGCGVLACAALWLFLPAWDVYSSTLSSYSTSYAVLGLALFGIVTAVWSYFNDRAGKNEVKSVQIRPLVKLLIHVFAWVVAGAAGLVLHILVQLWLWSAAGLRMTHSYAVLGLPALLMGLSLISYLWVGIMGITLPEAQREWLGRAVGYFLAYALLFALVFAIAFYGPLSMHILFTGFDNASWKKSLLTIVLPGGWLFTVIAGLVGARSPNTDGAKPGLRPIDIAIAIAPPAFVVGVLLLTSWGAHSLVDRFIFNWNPEHQYVPWADWHTKTSNGDLVITIQPGSQAPVASHIDPVKTTVFDWATPGVQDPVRDPQGLAFNAALANPEAAGQTSFYLGLVGIFVVLAGLLAWRLNVNEFSEHLFYRNRLVRAFLGASHPDRRAGAHEQPRKANKFTGFAFDDDIFLKSLVAKKGFQGPYPIWGTCLNLTIGEDLAWQKRKGASFIYSPLFCGWDYMHGFVVPKEPEAPGFQADPDRWWPLGMHTFAYRSTLPSGDDPNAEGYVPGYSGYGGAPLIGTAMAASGAAISPNWGFHSKPAVAVLLTLFNLRLGWWTGNPRHQRTWKKYAPPIGYLAAELTGYANDERGYVYLSDGGHFENLGIYELVRRRVRFIISSDADADPDFEFEDLGTAISHCRRDFGVEIRIGAPHRITVSKEPVYREAHFAVGEIDYPGQSEKGLLLYIKSSLTSDEPVDVLATRAEHPNFPHDTTLNQFFDEQMFESYRALGQHIMTTLINQSDAMKVEAPDADGKKLCGARVRRFYAWLCPQALNGAPTTLSLGSAIKAVGSALAHRAEALLNGRT